MSARLNLTLAVLAASAAACGTGPRVAKIDVSPGSPRDAGDMVATWDAKKQAEVRCSYEQAGQQIGVDGKTKSRTVSPACGDYKP